jgi:steroid 5-alpha reductase family enzyme
MKKETIAKLAIGILILAIGVWLLSNNWASEFAISLGTIMGLMTLLWLLSLAVKDSSIVDIFWGTGFVIVVWLFASLTGFDELALRQWIFLSMVSIWGIRLTVYLAMRNIGKGEDYRYANWRKEQGDNWWWVSFFRVFVLQGVLLWLISAVYLPALKSGTDLDIWSYLGIVFWGIGFFFEAVGDYQMMRFRKERSDDSAVMNKGLWRYTRHPNYFGDAMQWWAYFFFALAHPLGWVYIFCPMIMTFFLLNVSGVAMLEEGLKNKKPKYSEYIRRTSAFIPMPPKSGTREP